MNVRAAADTESEKLGTLDQGTVVTRTAVDGDWSAIDYNGTTGYVKNEFLTYDLPDTTAENNSDSSSDNSDSTNSASIAEGTVIMLENTTNIRSGMSEDSSKVGTAYAGEKVTVVMSYAEGWTKVKWNGETRLHKDIFITVSGAAWLIPGKRRLFKRKSPFFHRENI